MAHQRRRDYAIVIVRRGSDLDIKRIAQPDAPPENILRRAAGEMRADVEPSLFPLIWGCSRLAKLRCFLSPRGIVSIMWEYEAERNVDALFPPAETADADAGTALFLSLGIATTRAPP
jgi:hypothetical protein